MFIWLRWVLVTELGLGVASWGSCAGAQPARGLCACGAGSALAARGLGCSAARGILVPKKEKVKVLVTQSSPTLRDPVDSKGPPGSSVHGVLQARILE